MVFDIRVYWIIAWRTGYTKYTKQLNEINFYYYYWFNYLEEIFIEAPFKTSLDNSEFITSHIHRPLEMYFHSLRNNNLRVIELIELMPERKIEENYPQSWEFPRFMVVKCIK